MGKYSNVVKKKLSMLASNFLIDTKITIIWNSPRKIRNLFSFKDRLPMRLRSKFLYRYVCDGCNSVYIGKSKRHFLVRAYEHLGLSLRTGKKFTYNPSHNNNSGILDHINCSNNCRGDIKNSKIIGQHPLIFIFFRRNHYSYTSSSPLWILEIQVFLYNSFNSSYNKIQKYFYSFIILNSFVIKSVNLLDVVCLNVLSICVIICWFLFCLAPCGTLYRK